jgi:hypothetical protein
MVWIVTFLNNWEWLLDGKVFLSIGSEYCTGLLRKELASGRLDDYL